MNFFILGGIGSILTYWTIFVLSTTDYMFLMTITEIGILKLLYIKKWSRMAVLDDYFFATFIGLMNAMLAFLNSSISLGMPIFENYVSYELLSGSKPNITEADIKIIEKVYFWWAYKIKYIFAIGFTDLLITNIF